MTRLRDYLSNSYLPKARDGYGLMYMKGGDELYAYMVQSTTTLPLTPEEIHQTGLSEVARITGEMEKVKQEVGFKGTLAQFFDYLRTDPKYKKPTREALTQGYYDIGKAVDAKLPTYFSTIPKSKLEIRPYEPFREKFEAGGSYEQGTPDGSRPGIFYFNAYDLPSRTTPGMTTLYLHEGAPGHHFQISWRRKTRRCRRSCGSAATPPIVEGWALYAETLGYEMGFYKDPDPALRNAVGRDAAGDAAGGRHRHPQQGLDPREGDRLHDGPQRHGQDRRHRRSRALYRHPEPGTGLQDRVR